MKKKRSSQLPLLIIIGKPFDCQRKMIVLEWSSLLWKKWIGPVRLYVYLSFPLSLNSFVYPSALFVLSWALKSQIMSPPHCSSSKWHSRLWHFFGLTSSQWHIFSDHSWYRIHSCSKVRDSCAIYRLEDCAKLLKVV